MAHTVAIGILTMPSKPAPTPGAGGRHGQVARRQAPADSNTRIVRPERRPPARPEKSAPLVPIQSTTLAIPNFTFDFAKIASRAAARPRA